MSRDPHRDAPYWNHSNPEPPVPTMTAEDVEAPEIPTPGSGLCCIPERGQPCTHDDGNARKALDGLLVCGRHTTLAGVWLKELPELWETLGDPTRVGGKPLGSIKRTDAPAPSLDAAEKRDKIAGVLVSLERTIHSLTRTPVTSEAVVRAESRRLAQDTSEALKGVATEQILFERIRDGKAKPEATPEEREKAGKRASEARKHADELRARWHTLDSRARSGRDVLDARAERVARYLDRLLSEPDHVVQTVTSLRTAWEDAAKAAYPFNPGIRVACPSCGTRVRLRWDVDIACPGEIPGPDGPEPCTEHGYAEWWAQQLGVDLRQQLTAEEAVAWLRDTHRITVVEATLRQWASRAKVTGSTVVRDGRHVTVYSPLELLDAATSQRPRTGATA